MKSGRDVIVVGGGLIGSAIAWRLASRGLRVTLIERGSPGREATWAAGGMLAPLSEADQDDAFLRLSRESLRAYPAFVAEVERASGLQVEYRSEGTLYLVLTDADEEELTHRWAWQQAAGLPVKRLSGRELLDLEPGLNPAVRWGLLFPEDHQVNNRRLSEAVSLAARRAGVEMLVETTVRRLLLDRSAGEARVTGVETDRGIVQAPNVLLAAGAWSSQLLEGLAPAYRVEPVRGQMVSLEMPAVPLRHVIYSARGYLVPRLGGHLIAGSTVERVGYDRRVTAEGLATVLALGQEIVPTLGRQSILEIWAGLRPRSEDGWPILGPDPTVSGLFHATGHYRNGILLTPITAEGLTEMIVHGGSPALLAPFSPARLTGHPPADLPARTQATR
jgi:glycine oxidase